MRKLSLLLVALLVISTGAFAQVTITPEIEVEASATFGVNLDEETHGLTNAAEATLSFVFTEEQTEEFGSGEVYGWIELDEFKIELEAEGNDTDVDNALVVSTGDISAKLFLAGPMVYIDILSATTEANEASNFSKIATDIVALDDIVGAVADVGTDFSAAPDPGKVALGFDLPDLMVIEFGVISAADWDDNAAPDNWYMLSVDAEIVAVPDFTITVVATAEMDDDEGIGGEGQPVGFGVGVEYTMPLTADIDLIPGLGFDYTTIDNGDDNLTRMEFGFGLNLSWAGIGTDEDDEDIFAAEDVEVSSGLGLGVVYGIHNAALFGGDVDENVNTLGVKVGLFEDSGDAGLLPVIGGALILNYNTVSGLEDAFGADEDAWSDLGLGIEVNADLGVISPYAGLTYVLQDVADDWDLEDNDTMYLNVGTDIDVIANTTFTVDFKSGELMNADDTYTDVIYGGGYLNSSRESGQFTIKTKISF